nr:MAG TPA: hypothetical protein [Caudoviricetes sp.]
MNILILSKYCFVATIIYSLFVPEILSRIALLN